MSRGLKLCLLAALFTLCGGAALFQSVLDRRWQSASPGELYSVVSSQLSAFRADNYPAAYRQVSMSFQERFNLQSFADLARTDYPALLHASRVEFGQARFQGRRAFLPAYFFLPDGEITPCIYSLIREENAWKIDNVQVLPRWPANRRLGGIRT